MPNARSEYYIVTPEVPGYLGDQTTCTSQFPARVGNMHYVFNAWPCDDLIEAYPCFAVSNRLREKLEAANVSGMSFMPCATSMSEDIDDNGKIASPCLFWRIEPVGKMKKDDISLDEHYRLIVSERVKKIIETFKPTDCGFEIIN